MRMGDVLTVTDALLNTTTYGYDGLGRKISETGADPDGSGPLGAPVTSYAYDAVGNLLSVTDPLAHVTTTSYDALNRKVSVTGADPDGSGPLSAPVTSYTYDAVGNVVTVTDPLGHVTTNGYDALNRKISVTAPDPDGTGPKASPVTLYSYDAGGNLRTVTDADNNVTTYGYDALNRQLTETTSAGTRTTVYDAAGNVTSTVDRDGRKITYTYDNLNRKVTENWLNSSGGTISTITSTYDAAGRLVTTGDANSTTTYAYDNLNRVVAETSVRAGLPSGTGTIAFASTYDLAGNRTITQLTIGGVIDSFGSAAYDALNRVSFQDQVGGAGTSVAPKRIDYTYDAASNLVGSKYSANLVGTLVVASNAYGYDGMNRVTGITQTVRTSPSATTRSYGYGYDAASRLMSQTSFDGTANYSYDNDNQLLTDSLSSENYIYDANGNRTSTNGTTTTSTTNNELSNDGTYSYAYDNEGNLISQTKLDGSQTILYTWDYRNRLTNVTYQNASHVTTESVSYTYDTQNRRIAQTATGTTNLSEQYVYDGSDLLVALNPSTGQVTQRYFNGIGINGQTQALAEETVSTGSTKWALTDDQGSVKDLIDNASGHAILNHIVYDSYGNVTSQTNASNTFRMGYTGYQQDTITGLDYANARYYQPKTGKFLSTDPSGFSAGDTNLYRYVGNDPTNAIDPTGLEANLGFAGHITGGTASPILFGGDSLGGDYNFLAPASSVAQDSSFETPTSLPLSWSTQGVTDNPFADLPARLAATPAIDFGGDSGPSLFSQAIYPLTHPMLTGGAISNIATSLATLHGSDALGYAAAYGRSAQGVNSYTGGSEYSTLVSTTSAGGLTVANAFTGGLSPTISGENSAQWQSIGMDQSGYHTASKIFAGVGAGTAYGAGGVLLAGAAPGVLLNGGIWATQTAAGQATVSTGVGIAGAWAARSFINDPQGSIDSYLVSGVPFTAPLAGPMFSSGELSADEEIGIGYPSFSAFKRAQGAAGEGQAWHHIVEQTSANVERFGAEAIHNTNNLIVLPNGPGSIHNQISGFYSSKQLFTGGQTVRQWLSPQSFTEQSAFGKQIMQQFGGGQ